MVKSDKKLKKELDAVSDESGRIFECVLCHDWTGHPYEHLVAKHPAETYVPELFNLIRGALHTSRPVKVKAPARDVPLPFQDGSDD